METTYILETLALRTTRPMGRAPFRGGGGVQPPPPPPDSGAEFLKAPKKRIFGLNKLVPKAPKKFFDWPKAWKKIWHNLPRGVPGWVGGWCAPPLLKKNGAELSKGA